MHFRGTIGQEVAFASRRLKGGSSTRRCDDDVRRDGDDPRSDMVCEDRGAMNDRTKLDTDSLTEIRSRRPPMTSNPEEDAPRRSKSRLRTSEPYMTWLGQSLRQSYEETLNETVPESFSSLLDRLEQEDGDNPAR